MYKVTKFALEEGEYYCDKCNKLITSTKECYFTNIITITTRDTANIDGDVGIVNISYHFHPECVPDVVEVYKRAKFDRTHDTFNSQFPLYFGPKNNDR